MAEKKRRPAGRKVPEVEPEDDLSPQAVQRLWEKRKRTWSKEICLRCASLVWPLRREGCAGFASWRVVWPICVDHPDSPGVPREVHPAEGCPNFRPRPQPAVRVQPPPPERPTDRYIPLTRGLWVVVDVADFARLNRHRWYASPSGGGKMYARRNTKHGTILMHREIMHAPKGMVVDHKDRNGLNNRPDNLRVCRPAQNEYNKAPRGRRSRFKGVYPDGGKWCSAIRHQGVTYYLGTFDSEVEAARARDRKARALEGEYAYLNLPEEAKGPDPPESPAGKGKGVGRRSGGGKSAPTRKKRGREET